MYQLFHMELDLIFTRLTPCEMVDAYIGYIINFFILERKHQWRFLVVWPERK